MSVVEDVRNVLQDFLAPEIRSINARLDALEKKVDANEVRAESRHNEVMVSLRQVTDYAAVLERLSRLEARQEVRH